MSPNTLGPAAYPPGRGRTSPASRKTTGHCPQFPPNLGIVPGSSNGLGVAPGHWGLPPGSRSPSAASTACRRELAPVSAPSAPANTSSSLAVSSPLPPRSGPAPGPHPPPSCRGWRSPRAAAGAGARLGRPPGKPARGAGARYRLAAGRPRSLRLGAPKPAPLLFAFCKDRNCGKNALAAPKLGGQGAGSEGRRGEAHPGSRGAARRLQPAGQRTRGGARGARAR